MNYLPETAVLVQQIRDGWRSDMSRDGRSLKAIGMDGREQLARSVEQAAKDRKP